MSGARRVNKRTTNFPTDDDVALLLRQPTRRGRSGTAGDLDFISASGRFGQYALFRYDVMLRGVFLGQVYMFRSERYASTMKWAAQGVDGVVYGVTSPFNTRAEAGRHLVAVQS